MASTDSQPCSSKTAAKKKRKAQKKAEQTEDQVRDQLKTLLSFENGIEKWDTDCFKGFQIQLLGNRCIHRQTPSQRIQLFGRMQTLRTKLIHNSKWFSKRHSQ